jgi:hypothetical protein
LKILHPWHPRNPRFSLFLIKDCLKRAARLIRGDLDEENLHLTELRVGHLVNPLRQTQLRRAPESQRKWIAERAFRRGSRPRFGKFYGQRTIGEDNLEILVETGGEVRALDFGEIEHAEMLMEISQR